jgi:folate-binding protein YgfZ
MINIAKVNNGGFYPHNAVNTNLFLQLETCLFNNLPHIDFTQHKLLMKPMPQIDSTENTQKNYLSHLDDKGLIQLGGEERVKYLQGQVTADMDQLSAEQALLSCHCDFKGKTWNVFYALQHQESILMLSHQESIPASITELQKYGVFAKVDIQDSTEQWCILGGAGAELEALIDNQFGDLPSAHQQVLSNELGLVMCLTVPHKRYLLLLNPQAADTFINAYPSELSSAGLWEQEDIQAAIPEIRSATSKEFVPQMMNLHALDAISFSKGCYMGQEVVARTKFLGKNKRAAFILRAEKAVDITPGDALESQAGENWRRGGAVLRASSSVQAPQQTWLLAVLANDTEVGATLRLKAQPQVLLKVQPLPYSLE